MRVNRWTIGRRSVQLLVLALLASPALGYAFFAGNLGSAVLFGLRLSDPLATLQILVLTGGLTTGLLLGVVPVLALYTIIGGRAFCGWACPVHLLTDLVELLPGAKRRQRIGLRWKELALWLVLALSLWFGLPLFETLSPIGVAGRALTFGAGSGLVILVLILLLELLWLRRAWCRSLCPLGGFYALLGRISPVAVVFHQERCTHCGECETVCFVPEVLQPSLTESCSHIHSGDCSRCGACIGICPEKALNFGLRKPF